MSERCYGGEKDDYGFSVAPTPDRGCIVVGNTSSFGAGRSDIYLVKTDVHGDTLWTMMLGGADYDIGYSVRQTADGYIIAGLSESHGAGGEDVYLVRTNADGDTLWTRTYGGPNSDEAHSVQETADGGFVVAGSTYSFGAGNFDGYLIRTGPRGELIWTKTLGGTGDDGAWSVAPAVGGGFFVAGYRSSATGDRDVLLVRTDSAGNLTADRPKGH